MVVSGMNRSALFPHLGQRIFETRIISINPIIALPALSVVKIHAGGSPQEIFIIDMTASWIKSATGNHNQNKLRR
jgi:hypothetical protein